VIDLPDTKDIDVPARHQPEKSSTIPRRIWVMKHEHREIHADMGVQVNPEMPKILTPLQDSGAYHDFHIPIGDRTMENLAGNTGKRSCQMSYTPRTYKMPSITATGMENGYTNKVS
jgi:hypothetical protein